MIFFIIDKINPLLWLTCDVSRLKNLFTIILESQYPELAKDREKLEDALDVPTINRIIKICGGIDLEDPNLLAAAVLAGTN